MEIAEELHDFNFASFIIGTGIFVILPVIASYKGIDILVAFAAIGPFYIGYKSKNYKQGFAVGGLSGIFLWVATIYGALGEITYNNLNPILLNAILFVLLFVTGGFIATIGQYFKSNRQAAIQMANKNKKGSKNVQKSVKPIDSEYKKISKKFKK